jgi:hypothetical protein
MRKPGLDEAGLAGADKEGIYAALFCDFILQHATAAFVMLGKAPDPESGETVRDVETAKMLIDHLEMLQVKTEGNLGDEEAATLRDSLLALKTAMMDEFPNGE